MSPFSSQLVPASNKDVVDALRAIGLDSLVSLPAIIVGGDTSSGKSSLLTAVSGLQFPSNTGLTTRCPTEVMLTRSPTKSAVVTLRFCPGMEQSINFNRALQPDWSDFASVVTEATALLTKGHDENYITPNAIVVRAQGPDLPDLTLIDLPGLVAATGTGESKDMIQSIRKMIMGHMQSSRSVILCVLPANNDFHNSAILTMAKDEKCDPTGLRTLGIVTKPDLVDMGSEGEVVKLAKNEKVALELGWHAVKLRSQQDLATKTLAKAEEEEIDFFEKQPWNELDPKKVGVPQLRQRLQRLLAQRVQSELPSVREEVKKRLQLEEGKLDGMGHDYDDVAQQREVFATLVHRCAALLEAASAGHYEDDFFAQADPGYSNNMRARIFAIERTFKEEICKTRFMCIGHYDVGDKIVHKGRKGSVELLQGERVQIKLESEQHGKEQVVAFSVPHYLSQLQQFLNDEIEQAIDKCASKLEVRMLELLKQVRERPYTQNPLYMQLVKRHRSQLQCQIEQARQVGAKEVMSALAAFGFNTDESADDDLIAVEYEFRLAAYLEVACKRFIDEMPMMVHTILVKPVLHEVQMMQVQGADAKLGLIFAQDEQVRQERAKLRGRVKVLRNAVKVLA